MFCNNVHNDSDFMTPNVLHELQHKILRMKPMCGLGDFCCVFQKRKARARAKLRL